jgi:hypothetical protein
MNIDASAECHSFPRKPIQIKQHGFHSMFLARDIRIGSRVTIEAVVSIEFVSERFDVRLASKFGKAQLMSGWLDLAWPEDKQCSDRIISSLS